jgi:hypothetical protein
MRAASETEILVDTFKLLSKLFDECGCIRYLLYASKLEDEAELMSNIMVLIEQIGNSIETKKLEND